MKDKVFYFVTGSQHLYGEETLKQVAKHSQEIAEYINNYKNNPCTIVFKPIVTTPDEIYSLCLEAENDKACAGVITWMHTFSPAKMWINGLNTLKKPLLHLHTQYNRNLPWADIDMDFMNLNQSAHGDREYGFINTRLRKARKVVVGFWQDEDVLEKISGWMRVAAAFAQSKALKVARFGDNMREVAVTEGDKVEAQIKFGWAVNGYGLGDLKAVLDTVTEAEVDKKVAEYLSKYSLNTDNIASVREQAKIEVAICKFLKNGGFNAFTTTFENLYGLKQLPGLAAQSLMEKGYGFGAEGDWKTSAMVYLLKYMAEGLNGGTSFMEDYTYHLEKGNELALGAHMLEVCPTIAKDKPKIEVHELGIGGKEAPARLVFDSEKGNALAVSLIDMGGRFRLIVNKVEVKELTEKMPKLPVARVLWKPLPDLKTSAAAWIYAGGAHHTVLTFALSVEQLYDFAKMADIEFVLIDETTDLIKFEQSLALSDTLWQLKGLK